MISSKVFPLGFFFFSFSSSEPSFFSVESSAVTTTSGTWAKVAKKMPATGIIK
jgi:hypothetical protein